MDSSTLMLLWLDVMQDQVRMGSLQLARHPWHLLSYCELDTQVQHQAEPSGKRFLSFLMHFASYCHLCLLLLALCHHGSTDRPGIQLNNE